MTPTIPEAAVNAAAKAIRRSGDTYTEMAQAALTAALPFLQGVKVDAQGIYDYVQSYEWRGDNGDYTPSDADREMLEDAIVGYLSAIETVIPVSAPSPRAQALDLRALENLSAKADEYDYADDIGPFPDIQDAMVSVGDLRAVRKLLPEIRALSHPVSPDMGVERPVADGWLPIETAPRDGTEVLAWRYDSGPFIASFTSCSAFPMSQAEIDEIDEDTLFKGDWFTQWPQALRLEGSEVPTHWRPLPQAPGVAV